MSRKTTGIILGIVVIVIAGGLVLWSRSAPMGAPTTSTSAVTSASSSSGVLANYTLADVAKHNNASSCWTAINGSVYDVTSWISQHPGGPEHILSICGIDGSAAFNTQHGTQSEPNAMLATFKIGTLISSD